MLGKMGLLLLGSAVMAPALQAHSLMLPPHTASEVETKRQSDRRLFAIILKPGPSWKRGKAFSQQGLEAHFRYLKALVEKGDILSAGGLGNDHGLILLYAKDQEAADIILDNDPAVLQGTFVGEARPYGIRLLGAGALAMAGR